MFLLANAKSKDDYKSLASKHGAESAENKSIKTEDKKNQQITVRELEGLNDSVRDLIQTTRELDTDVDYARSFATENLTSKLRSSLSAPLCANDDKN